MSGVFDWIRVNQEWFLSGLGVFLLGLLVAGLKKLRGSKERTRYSTKGDYSPNTVGRDYNVRQDTKK